MAGNKKPRKSKKKLSQKILDIRAGRALANEKIMRDAERAHYIREFASLNEPMTQARCDYAFLPLENAVFEIEETGDGHTDEKGRYIFMPVEAEGIWYGLPSALIAACDVFGQTGDENDVAALRRLAKRLELHAPLLKEDMDGARASFKAMRAQAMTMTPRQLIDIVEAHGPFLDI